MLYRIEYEDAYALLALLAASTTKTLREQMLYRITRADDSDACIVLHFLPVEMVSRCM